MKQNKLFIFFAGLLLITACTPTENNKHNQNNSTEQIIPKNYTINFTVSNQPLFLLSEAVTQGTPTTVYKLLQSGDVGHHASLSPSDIKNIQNSKYVVWFGKGLENNLANTLKNQKNTITILQDKSIELLPKRDTQAKIIENSIDPHIWLEPNNAKIIVNKLAELHEKANPKYAKIYQENAQKFAKDLDKLVKNYADKMPKKNKYWSSHDTFQYLEKSLNIELVGTLTTDHEIPVKVSQIVWLNKTRPYPSMCLLSQNKVKNGISEKLNSINNQILMEDMSDSKSYLQAWEKSAEIIDGCLR
ncbi:MAG: zinc ABC transporter substrate-binding protein [Moraxellaceae bacterium]|nr:zinc ABC transporter substrate-binding protein [Moraxellaceae bacterium]